MNYQQSLTYLFSLRKFGMRFDLSRIKKFLIYLDNPQNKIQTIHIAGTNGKGSTSSFIASILKELNYKVGLYTSPHLSRFNERIVVNGIQIEDQFIVDFLNVTKKNIDELELTFFDITTAMAFLYFAEKKVDYAVIETGLGGRLDSTNVITPIVSVITSIGLDHQNILGNTIFDITLEKAGIIKNEVPVVVSDNLSEIRTIIHKKAIEKKSKMLFVPDFYKIIKKNKEFPKFQFEISSFFTNFVFNICSPLFSDFQIDNISTAIAVAELIIEKKSENMEKLVLGIENLQNNFPIVGRFQMVEEKPLTIIDTSHNTDAIKKVVTEFGNFPVKKKYAVFGIMKDKNIDDVIEDISLTFDKILLCSPHYDRSMPVSELIKKFLNSENKVKECSDLTEALFYLSKEIKVNDGVLIFGSNYLIAEYLDLKKINFLNYQQII